MRICVRPENAKVQSDDDLRYASVSRSLLLRNRSIYRSLLTLMRTSGMPVILVSFDTVGLF